MATITLENPYYYQNGVGGASAIVGYEGGGGTRVVRFTFTSPSSGASHISFSIWFGYMGGNSSIKPLRFYIGTSDSSHANAGQNAEYTGTVTVTESAGEYTFAGEADVLLTPNTTYYLWMFPSDTSDGWCYYSLYPNRRNIETSGGAGLVYIDNGSGWDVYQVYIDNGTGWDLYMPYIDNSSGWDLYT